jgi:hypothetical protein
MYKSIHRDTGEEIISLSPEWRKRLEDLRALDHADLLVCQSCRQPVRVKAGAHRRTHFAHKHLKGCSYGAESPAILEARGALYEWLLEQFPGRVTVEKSFPDPALPRAVDCWVDAAPLNPLRPLAYWVIDAPLKLEARETIQAALAQTGAAITWVFTTSMLHVDPKTPGRIRLSPTERDFTVHSPYDEIGRESRITTQDFGASLHYLDPETQTLVTYRSLDRVHAPNIFSGRIERRILSLTQASPDTGEFVHPGEENRLVVSRDHRARRDARIQRWLQPSPQAPLADHHPWNTPDDHPGGVSAAPATLPQSLSQLAVCIYCGEETEDYWMSWIEGGARKCKCHPCLEKGLE